MWEDTLIKFFDKGVTNSPRIDLSRNPLQPPFDHMCDDKFIYECLLEMRILQRNLTILSEFSIQDICLDDYENLLPQLDRWHKYIQPFLNDFFHKFPLVGFLTKFYSEHGLMPRICNYLPLPIVAEVYPILHEQFSDSQLPQIKHKYDLLNIYIQNKKSSILL